LYIPKAAVILKDTTTGYLYDRLKDEMKEEIANGFCFPHWTILQIESTYVGVFPLCGYSREQTDGGLRFKISGEGEIGESGYVIFCETMENISFAKFSESLDSIRIGKAEDTNFVLHYYVYHNHVNLLDRQQQKAEHEKNAYWLFHSPYLESKKGSGVLTMRYKGKERVLDFN
jgi:hypothetical protein